MSAVNSDKQNDTNPASLPALGRAFLWVESASAQRFVLFGLYLICAALIVMDFFYKKKSYFDIENIPGSYAIYGILGCIVLVLLSGLVRAIVKRKEDYYAPRDVDAETHPHSDLAQETIHD